MEAAISQKFDLRHDRVRAHTNPIINRRIDEATVINIRRYAQADRQLISRRLEELDREWDMERTLEANAASIVLAGLSLGALVNRKWFFLPGIVAGFLLQHAVQGW